MKRTPKSAYWINKRRQACFEVAAAELEEAKRRGHNMTPKQRQVEKHAAEMRVVRVLAGCNGKRVPIALEQKIRRAMGIQEAPRSAVAKEPERRGGLRTPYPFGKLKAVPWAKPGSSPGLNPRG